MSVRGTLFRRSGFILLVTLLMMGALSAMAGAFSILLSADMRNLAIQTNDAKAIWLAEAGIADAVKRLKNSEIVLNDGGHVALNSVSLGDGTYAVALSRKGNDIVINSEGAVRGQLRQLEVVFTAKNHLPYAFQYAVFGNNPNGATLSIGSNNNAAVQISGDLFYNPTPGVDTVNVTNKSSVVNGLVYADKVTGKGAYRQAETDPDPIPIYPSFDMTYYDKAIAVADGSIIGNLNLNGSSRLNLAGRTLYYRIVTISDNATVIGPGTVVATQPVTIRDNANIGFGVHVIAKSDITIRDFASASGEGSFFTRSAITLRDDVEVFSSLLAPKENGKITIQNNAVLTGMIYGDTVNLKNNVVINGSVVGNRYSSNQISDNAHVNFDSSYLPEASPIGMTGLSSLTQKADSWKELT